MRNKKNSLSDNLDLCLKDFKQFKIAEIKGTKLNETGTIDWLNTVIDGYYKLIHNELAKSENDFAKEEINKRVKEITSEYLPYLKIKLDQCNKSKTIKIEYKQILLRTYEKAQAICAFRSLEYFALFMENDKPENEKIWQYCLDCFKGFFLYATRMLWDGSVNRIFKQYPTGYGKTYSDSVFIAWILGHKPNADILKVVGNPSLVDAITTAVSGLMLDPKFALVFPEYEKYECNPNKMFDILRIKDGLLKISDSQKLNFKIINKDTKIDGGRFMFRFYDDITRSDDAESLTRHAKDLDKYDSEWKRRKYDDIHDYEVFSGTAYCTSDFIDVLKERYNKGDEIVKSKLPYTYKSKDRLTVFIQVPKLDYLTDQSTYPHRYSTEIAREERNLNYRRFMAMEQQMPLPPEGTPFYWDKILTYTSLPKKESAGGTRSDYARAAIDMSRKGKDKIAMGIFSKDNGDESEYLIDCIYKPAHLHTKNSDGSKVLDEVVDKIIQHNVSQLAIEVNTDSDANVTILEACKNRGYLGLIVVDVYSTLNKEDRIRNNAATILNKIHFPANGMYAISSQMGQFMQDMTMYCYNKKNDDGIDMVSMFSSEYLRNKPKARKPIIVDRRGMWH